MSRAFADGNVKQAVLFPATARDDVPEDHPVHDMRQLVAEEQDLASVFESYRDGAGAGNTKTPVPWVREGGACVAVHLRLAQPSEAD